MKRFIQKCFLFGLLILLSIVGVLFWMAKYPDNGTLNSHEINVKLSAERLATIDTTKLIIIGGSGCGFGLNSELIHNHFNIPVVNTGTHASIGIVLQLKLYEQYYREGDIIVIIPEYQQFSKKYGYGISDETLYRIIYNHYREGFECLTFYQSVNTIKYIPKYFKNAYARRKGNSDIHSPYHKLSLNQYGDVTAWGNRKHKRCINSQIVEGNPSNEIITFLADFIQRQSEKNINVLLFPPAYMDESYSNSKLFINELTNLLEIKRIPFLVSTERYKLDKSYFYDTSYHLTYEGAIHRTNMLIHDIDSIVFLEN